MKGKGKYRSGKDSNKRGKEFVKEFTNAYLDNGKAKKKTVGRKLRSKEQFEEKDTQDDSETAKIAHCHLSPKQQTAKHSKKGEPSPKSPHPKLSSNKNQPVQKLRSRIKSFSSVVSNRKQLYPAAG
jgi:hypothetical protein